MTTIVALILRLVSILLFTGAAIAFGTAIISAIYNTVNAEAIEDGTRHPLSISPATIVAGVLCLIGGIILAIVSAGPAAPEPVNAIAREGFIWGGYVFGVAGVLGVIIAVLLFLANLNVHFRAHWTRLVAGIGALIIGISSVTGGMALSTIKNEPPVSETQDEPAQEPEEEIEPHFFMIDLDDQQVEQRIKKWFGESFDIERDICLKWSDASMPGQNDDRYQAIVEAMQKYVDPSSPGFSCSVNFPLYDALAYYYDTTGSVKDEAALRKFKLTFYLETLRNPVQADMLAQTLLRLSQEKGLEGIIEDNLDWFPGFVSYLDDIYSQNEEGKPKGLSNLFEATVENKLMLKRSFVLNTARMLIIMDNCGLEGIESEKSKVNWQNGFAANANFARTHMFDDPAAQEGLPYLAFVIRYKPLEAGKPGNRAAVVGINIFDQRTEIIDLTKPEPKPSTPTVTTPPATTTTTTTTTTPKPPVTTPDDDDEILELYNLRIEYYYADTGKQAAKPFDKDYKGGEHVKVTSPTIKGYTPDYKVIEYRKYPKKDIYRKVLYYKDEQPTPTQNSYSNYQIRYREIGTEKTLYPSEQGTAIVGKYYSFKSPVLKGYELVNSSDATVSFTATKNDFYYTVYYRSTAKKESSYQIKYHEQGTEKVLFSSIQGTTEVGKYYSFKSPTSDKYELVKSSDATVSFTATEKPFVYTVYYKAKAPKYSWYRIHYVDQQKRTIRADAYLDKAEIGKTYSVTSPTLGEYSLVNPSDAVVTFTVPEKGFEYWVYYKSNNTKDPSDSNGEVNPEHPGENNDDPGPGNYQPEEPPAEDYTDPDNGGNGTNAGDPHRQEVSEDPLTPNDPEDSSGLGGQDHPITDPNGGNTDNGDPPDKDKIDVDPGTTGGGGSTNFGDEDPNSGLISPP